MIHEILQSDVEVARRLISSGHPDPEIVVALTARGIEPAKADMNCRLRLANRPSLPGCGPK